MKYLFLPLMMLLALSASAQEVDTMDEELPAETIAADSVAVADEPVKQEAHPVHSVRTLGKVSAIDTLATESPYLSIILFNDNTWRYVMAEEFRNDPEVFSDHWNTTATHAYSDVELSSLPEATPIRLVDSLGSYHHPYIGRITSRYGPRRGRAHQGLDISLKIGDPVYATFDGKVRISRYERRGYGHYLVIRHPNGLETLYGHLSKKIVKENQIVRAGEPIGLGGNTGRSTGSHLHFETRILGKPINPAFMFNFPDQCAETDVYVYRKSDDKEVYYKVKSGDTLTRIAARNETTVSSICKLNGISRNAVLRVGQTLRVN